MANESSGIENRDLADTTSELTQRDMTPLSKYLTYVLLARQYWQNRPNYQHRYQPGTWPADLEAFYNTNVRAGMTRKQIARDLGVTDNALKIRLERVRKK